ncbi:MAG TPA: D-alanine--D-alanine ligase [Acidobacteriota bacterium]|nr:D-alanine--D-alanine ligase [Acidobacteriota bacterium]
MKFRPREKLRIVVLVREGLVPPDSVEGLSEEQMQPWRTEHDVISALRSMGHEVHPVALYSDLGVIRTALYELKPHVAFNLLEEFHGDALYDQHVVSFLELMRQPYTGCNPRGLTLAHDKALSKKILSYHRILVPAFGVFPINRKVRRPKRLKFPLLVKSLIEEGSTGISQSSIVYEDEKLAERVDFIHRQIKTHAIAEQYIEGREIYVAIIGNRKLQIYTPWELLIQKLPEGAPNIATGKVKWSRAYQTKVGVVTQPAELTPALERTVRRISKRIYRTLSLSGYVRLDFRLTPDGRFYLLEANPNPDIQRKEDFAQAAAHSGVQYEVLLQKIITLGLSYNTAAS